MRFTSREKVLLIVLSIIGIFAISYFLLFQPQMEKIAALTLDDVKYRAEVQSIETELNSSTRLDNEIKSINEKISEEIKRFYPEILQDKIMIVLNGLIKTSQLKSTNTSFNQPVVTSVESFGNTTGNTENKYPLKDLAESFSKKPVDAVQQKPSDQAAANNGGTANQADNTNKEQINQLESMTVNLQLEGTYDQIMGLLKKLEGLDRAIIIKNMIISSNDQGLLLCNIQVDFYSLPKISEQDKDYYDWPFNNTYGKVNPFAK